MKRNYLYYLVSPNAFKDLFVEGSQHSFKVNQGMPADAKIVDVEYTFDTDKIALKVWSSTFPELKDGMMVPPAPAIVLTSL